MEDKRILSTELLVAIDSRCLYSMSPPAREFQKSFCPAAACPAGTLVDNWCMGIFSRFTKTLNL
jgi:hypothetical protein